MPLIGINPARGKDRGPTTLEKIAQGFSIAQSALGLGLAVPDFLQKRAESKAAQKLAQEKLGVEKERSAQEGLKTDISVAETLRPAKTGEEPISFLPKRFGPMVLRSEAQEINKADELLLKGYLDDFSPAQKDDSGAFQIQLGGRDFFFKEKKAAPEDLDKEEERERKLRQEFLKQSGEFISQTSSYQRVLDSARDPSAAGDLALIFNFMKILDPGSVVRESEFANARNSAGVPERIRAQYNRVLSGEQLGPVQRRDFSNRAKLLYGGAARLHKKREDQYTMLSEARDLDASRVVLQIGVGAPVALSKEDTVP